MSPQHFTYYHVLLLMGGEIFRRDNIGESNNDNLQQRWLQRVERTESIVLNIN